MRSLYSKFIAPRQQNQEARNREIVLTLLAIGTFVALSVLTTLLAISYIALGNDHIWGRLLICLGGLGYTSYVYVLARRQRYRPAAILLTLLYAIVVSGMMWFWGIHLAFTLVLWGLVIVLAGILLDSRFTLLTTALAVGTTLIILLASELGWHQPDERWMQSTATTGDAIGYCILFMGLGAVSWLFGRQTERSLRRAAKAEAELLKEQSMLETKIEQRTLELQVAQFKEMQQLYRFAELGHLSVALLHDLANHLTVLTLNIDDFEQKEHSTALNRAKRSIKYLDDMVNRVRDQLHGKSQFKIFSASSSIRQVISLLQPKAREQKVTVECRTSGPRQSLQLKGDPVKFNQLTAIVIANAMEAYGSPKTDDQTRLVDVSIAGHEKEVVIKIANSGKPITAAQRKVLFEPFHSTKKKGMGIGLYIARRILEGHFSGTITLSPSTKVTEFVIRLPHEH